MPDHRPSEETPAEEGRRGGGAGGGVLHVLEAGWVYVRVRGLAQLQKDLIVLKENHILILLWGKAELILKTSLTLAEVGAEPENCSRDVSVLNLVLNDVIHSLLFSLLPVW